MSVGILLLLSYFFYIAGRRSSDGFMIFCAIYALVLATGLFFYRLDSAREGAETEKNAAKPLPQKKEKEEK